MCRSCMALNSDRADPTRMGTLRKQWEADFGKRLRGISSDIRASIKTNDALAISVNEELPEDAFEGQSVPEKSDNFDNWLLALLALYLLRRPQQFVQGELVSVFWADTYIDTAYTRGMSRAAGQIVGKTSIPIFPDPVDPMGQPVHREAVYLLRKRAFSAVKTLSDDMAAAMSQIVASGLTDGLTNAQITKLLLNEIKKQKNLGDLARYDSLGRKWKADRRAKMIVNTEISRAYNEAVLNVYEQMGITSVKGVAEFVFTTVGDARVCPVCASLEGTVFSIRDARGVIPVHPLCRCFWTPVF